MVKSVKKSPLNYEITDLDRKMTVLDGVLAGKTDEEMARQLDLRPKDITELKHDIKNTLTVAYLEKVEYMRAVIFARLEQLHQVASQRALGGLPVDPEDPDGEKLIPDRHWAKLDLEVLRDEIDLITPDLARMSQREAEGHRHNYTNIENQTIVVGSELYEVSLESMQRSWLQPEFDSESAAAIILQNTLPELPEGEIDDIAALKRRVDDAVATFGGSVLDEDDSG